jgi:cytochrome c peroxidase
MKIIRFSGPFLLLLLMGLSLTKCKSPLDLNAGIVVPTPVDNPQSDAKIALGKKLFFDTRLSIDGTVSCATCHKPGRAFTDNLTVSEGIKGQHTERNSPSLLNSAFLKTAMFDAHLETLELQVIVPIQEKTEMGHNMKDLMKVLRADPDYQKAAQEIYHRDFDAWVLTRSISAYERSLISMNSRFDQFQKGNQHAINATEKAGWKLFSETLYCTKCHPAPNFTTYVAENNGLYASYEGKSDQGRFRIHHDSLDIGKFKVPSLRNLPLTYPYMHDGSLESIDAVLDHYVKGGNGHPLQHKAIVPFTLSPQERKQLKAFFNSLVDVSYLNQ